MTTEHVIVIGGGAWGLPAALALRDRGLNVTLIERFEPGSPFASSGGSSRLWRLADTLEWRARAMRGTLDAMERIGERLGEPVFRTTGLLWRDDVSLPAVARALASISEPVVPVRAENVGDYFSGLQSDGRDALFVEQGGVVLADRLLSGTLKAFVSAGGNYRPNARAVKIQPGANSARVAVSTGEVLEAGQVLVAAGPGTAELLPGLDLALPLKPYIEQVVYLGDPSATPPAPDLPGIVDCPIGDSPGIYAMPNGARGYKVGLDVPLRPLVGGTLGEDLDRSEDPTRTELIRSRIERDIKTIPPHVLGTQVCTWTDSGDGDFIIGRTHASVVLACGDSGEGFKYAAFMGEYLSDLVTGGTGDAEFQESWEPRRFMGRETPRDAFDAIGRH